MAQKLPTIAIIGQANVGKSSLFNRFVGFNQAIVAREAGTTRDSVIGKVHYGAGRDRATFNLIDTAGLKTAEDEFEASIQDQIADASGAADVILVTVDATKYPSDSDHDVAKKALKSRKPVLLLLNKTDLKDALSTDEFRRLGIKQIFRTSAEHSTGLGEVIEAIADEVPPVKADEAGDVLKIALIGRPNVGKSYLFNTLAGKQQAIVANVAGTTRDVNRVRVRVEGRDIEVLDTAGVRRSGRQEVGIEKFSVLRTLSAIDEADVCFLLMDANELNVALDQKLAGIIKESGKGLVLVVSKWDAVEDKDAYTRDSVAPRIAHNFAFVPWAPLIFTSSVTGQNVTKLYELALLIDGRRYQEVKTRELNKVLQECLAKHPPAGLKNSHPKLRYMVQTDVAAPWFVIYGSNLKFIHWSYKRYIETQMREQFDFAGTPIKFSFRDEKQLKANRERIAAGKDPRIKNGSESFIRRSIGAARKDPDQPTELKNPAD